MAALNCYDICRCNESKHTQCTHCAVKNIHNFSVDMFDIKNCQFDQVDEIDPFKNLPSYRESKYVKVDNLDETKEAACFSLLSLNIRSIRNNFQSLEQMLQQSKIKYDIIAISETLLDNTCVLNYFILPVVQNICKRVGGGVMLYFSERVECYRELREYSHVDEYNNISTVEYIIGEINK